MSRFRRATAPRAHVGSRATPGTGTWLHQRQVDCTVGTCCLLNASLILQKVASHKTTAPSRRQSRSTGTSCRHCDRCEVSHYGTGFWCIVARRWSLALLPKVLPHARCSGRHVPVPPQSWALKEPSALQLCRELQDSTAPAFQRLWCLREAAAHIHICEDQHMPLHEKSEKGPFSHLGCRLQRGACYSRIA